MATGCSLREINFSIERGVAAPTWLALPLSLACGWLEAATILFNSLLAVMIGVGKFDPPNMLR